MDRKSGIATHHMSARWWYIIGKSELFSVVDEVEL
jgi:hypothetical protein